MRKQITSSRRTGRRAYKRSAIGAKPGTLTIQLDAQATTIRVMAYNKEKCVEQAIEDPKELQKFLDEWPVVWVDVAGLGTEEKLRAIAEIFHIHPLALEDVVHLHQRAKADAYEEDLFIVLRVPDPTDEHTTEQFSMLLGKKYLVTFQERAGDCFDLIRSGIRQEQSTARQCVLPDYLAYRLIDASIDAYFPVLEAVGDHLDELDGPAAIERTRTAFNELHAVRRKLLTLRQAIWPIRDAISELRSENTPFIADTTRVYLRDCYDHAVQLIDLMESYRDIAGDVRDYYLSTISNRMNEIMKTLTVIATIFLPITFIAGVYGMNFNPNESPWNMPELNWRFGYFFALGLMVAVTLAMLWYFKRRGWLHSTVEEK
ncbi:MAG TPA: magnesium/cobalt transporter CorA, partial [Lacipirellulaceae bacterium]|nr:magnesium/cobalt transporter CorA [Lacipirellulaceae bacterium]